MEGRLILLETEVGQLRQQAVAAAKPARSAATALEGRPDMVRFLNSRVGWLTMALIQHGVWAARRRVQLLRSIWLRPPSSAQLAGSAHDAGLPEPAGALPGDPDPAALDAHPLPSRTEPVDTVPEAASMPPDLAPAAEPPEPGPRLSAVAFHPGILQRRPRILIDITPTARLPPFTGGIARVARGLGEAGVTTGLALPVYIVDGVLHPYYRHALLQGPIALTRDDIFVVVDVFWFFLPEYRLVVEQFRAARRRVALIVHDIGAIRFPGLFPRHAGVIQDRAAAASPAKRVLYRRLPPCGAG